MAESKEHHEHAAHHDAHADAAPAKKEADSKKSLIAVAIIVIIIIAILAVIAIISQNVKNKDNSVEYNYYVFTKFEGNKWMTQQYIRGQLYNIPFYYNPTQVLDIAVDPNSVNLVRSSSQNNNSITYVTVDANESSRVVIAGIEYARLLGTAYNIYNMHVKSALTTATGNESIPAITCKDSSKDRLVIYQTVTGKNVISTRGYCIILESTNATESIRVADAFAFRLLDIIQE